MDTFLTELAKSGPWALVAGFLIWMLVKERQAFQAKVLEVLDEFKSALHENTRAITKLADHLNHLERSELSGEL